MPHLFFSLTIDFSISISLLFHVNFRRNLSCPSKKLDGFWLGLHWLYTLIRKYTSLLYEVIPLKIWKSPFYLDLFVYFNRALKFPSWVSSVFLDILSPMNFMDFVAIENIYLIIFSRYSVEKYYWLLNVAFVSILLKFCIHSHVLILLDCLFHADVLNEIVSPKYHVHPDSQNVTLFRYRVFAYVKMRLYWIKVCPRSNDWCPYMKAMWRHTGDE